MHSAAERRKKKNDSSAAAYSVSQRKNRGTRNKFAKPANFSPGARQTAGANKLTVQRLLHLKITPKDDTWRKLEDPVEAYKEILEGIRGKGELVVAWESEKAEILEALKEWIEAPKPTESIDKPKTPDLAMKRAYESYEEVADAVLSRVRGDVNIRVEDAMAQRALRSRFIREKLQQFISMNVPTRLNIDQISLIQSGEGRYLPYLLDGKKKLLEILNNPSEERIGTLIAAIHDISDILYADEKFGGKELMTIPDEKLAGFTLSEDKSRLERTPLSKTFRGPSGTPSERDPHIVTARLLNMPVSLGPSRTTGRLMMLAEACKADKDTKEAIAWALFAFWYKEYRRDLTDIHRFHFTMDMAANFGVDYDPLGTPTLRGKDMRPEVIPDKQSRTSDLPDTKTKGPKTMRDYIMEAVAATGGGRVKVNYKRINSIKEGLNIKDNKLGSDEELLQLYRDAVDQLVAENVIYAKESPKDHEKYNGLAFRRDYVPDAGGGKSTGVDPNDPEERMKQFIKKAMAKIPTGKRIKITYRRANKISAELGIPDNTFDGKINLPDLYKKAAEALLKEGIFLKDLEKTKDSELYGALYPPDTPPPSTEPEPLKEKDIPSDEDTFYDDVSEGYASDTSDEEFDFDEEMDLEDYFGGLEFDEPQISSHSLQDQVPDIQSIEDTLTGTYFGTELTFTCPEMLIEAPRMKKAEAKEYYKRHRFRQQGIVYEKHQLWVDELRKELAQSNPYGATIKAKKKPGKTGNIIYRVKFRNIPDLKTTWWYDIDMDVPVIELATRRMTINQSKILAPIIQKYIFDFAQSKVGLTPHEYEGGGHIHIDVMTGFKNNPVKLLNFMTDIHNLGIWPFLNLGFMKKVAPPLSTMPDLAGKYHQLLEEQRQKGFGGVTLNDIIMKLHDEVYEGHGEDKSLHYTHISTRSYETRKVGLEKSWGKKDRKKETPTETDFLKVSTLEVRAHQGQKTYKELLYILHLYQQRLKVTTGEKLNPFTAITLPMSHGFPDYPGESTKDQAIWEQVAENIANYFDETPDVYLEDYLPMFSGLPEGLQKQIQSHSKKPKPSTVKDLDTGLKRAEPFKKSKTSRDSKKPWYWDDMMFPKPTKEPDVPKGHQGEVEHIYNSCYLASLLSVFANTPAYASLFAEMENFLPYPPIDFQGAQQYQAFLHKLKDFQTGITLQRSLIPGLIRELRSPGGKVNRLQVYMVLNTLKALGMIIPARVHSDPARDPQDAAEVLMRMLTVLQPGVGLQVTERYQIKRPDQTQFADSGAAENQSMLQLPIDSPGIDTVEKALINYCASENVELDHQIVKRRLRFRAMPAVFTFSLKRFKVYGQFRHKLTKKVSAPVLLTVPEKCLHPDLVGEPIVYRLKSFIHHSGSFGGGHYTTTTKDTEGNVQRSDDIHGRSFPGSMGEIKKEKDTAYMYIYERVREQDITREERAQDALDRNLDRQAESSSQTPGDNIDYSGLPAVGAVVVIQENEKTPPRFYRVLNKKELLDNIHQASLDNDLLDYETATVDGKVYLTDSPVGKPFVEIITRPIDNLTFESGSSYKEEFEKDDQFGESRLFTKEELSSKVWPNFYDYIQKAGYDRQKLTPFLTQVLRKEQRTQLKESFQEDIGLKLSYRGRVAEHIQRLVIALILEIDEGVPSELGKDTHTPSSDKKTDSSGTGGKKTNTKPSGSDTTTSKDTQSKSPDTSTVDFEAWRKQEEKKARINALKRDIEYAQQKGEKQLTIKQDLMEKAVETSRGITYDFENYRKLFEESQ